MSERKPLKRHDSLQPLSREHHHTLLLSWKIRQGFARNVEVDRIKSYVDWYYENHIKPHFRMEEMHIFPMLGKDDPMVKKALADHERIRQLCEDDKNPEDSLEELEKALVNHIRFEERELFQKLQEDAPEDQLKKIERVHTEEKFVDNMSDPFWI